MKPLKASVAFTLFLFVLCCAVADELWGKLRHGKQWESGDGLGGAEDYS